MCAGALGLLRFAQVHHYACICLFPATSVCVELLTAWLFGLILSDALF